MKSDKKELVFNQKKLCVGGLSDKGVDKDINQDAYRIGISKDKELAYVIVADGLGSCKYSDQGAKKITEIIEQWVLTKLTQYSFLSDNVANIMTKRIVEEWNCSYDMQEINQYDTTVHIAIYYKGSVLIGGIGDGMALLGCNRIICKDCIDKKDLFSNVTNSMCSINVNELMSFQIVQTVNLEDDVIMIVSTDGIADDLIPEKKLTLPDYFLDVIREGSSDALQEELEEWISDWETENHSDDKTICYLAVTEEV